MRFYGNIIAALYHVSGNIYGRMYNTGSDRKALRFSSIYTAACQIFLLLALTALIEKAIGIDLFRIQIVGVAIALTCVIWVFAAPLYYYTADRIKLYTDDMSAKTVSQRQLWLAIALLALLIPLFIIFLFWA